MTDKETDAQRQEVISSPGCLLQGPYITSISEGGSGRGRRITDREGQKERKKQKDKKTERHRGMKKDSHQDAKKQRQNGAIKTTTITTTEPRERPVSYWL